MSSIVIVKLRPEVKVEQLSRVSRKHIGRSGRFDVHLGLRVTNAFQFVQKILIFKHQS